MTSRYGRKCVKNEELNLQCEWNDCRQVYNDLSDFYTHLYDHFQSNYSLEGLQSSSTEKSGPFCCQWNECVYITNCQHDLLRHLYFHGYHTKVKWWGLLCFKKQNLSQCQTLHNRNIIPELPDGFKCEWSDCYMLFDVPDQFYMHVYNHAIFAEETKIDASQSSFKCQWEGCSYSYIAKGSGKAKVGKFKLREHLRSHTKERCYACPWCGNLYVNRTKFTDHLNRQMNIESHCFQCTHCSRTFATERLLKDHMRHHVNYYKCPKCAMTCPNPSGLKHHMKYKHSDERPFACQFCEYRSKTAYDLQVHLTFHQSDLSYRCHVKGCDYAVRSLQNLRYHFRTKHMVGKGNCYACHLCSKAYGVGFQLTNHLRSAHGFQWPPGHSRFRYKECDDGFFRLQTFRFESVELTEKLMVDDQSNSNKVETRLSKMKRPSVKSKSVKPKKRRCTTKHQQLPSNITRSATLLLQKAQSQRMNKSNLRLRSYAKKLNKKRVATKSQLLSHDNSAVNNLGLHERENSQAGNANTLIEKTTDISDSHDVLMTEFGGNAGSSNQARASNSTETLPLIEAAAPSATLFQRMETIETSDKHLSGDAQSENPSLSSLTTATAPLVPNQNKSASINGTWVRDETGVAKSVIVNGKKFYLLKCVDSSNTITYSLVSATSDDDEASSLT